MISQHELKNLFDILNSGSIENIALAIEIAKGSNIDLHLNQFEELFDSLQEHNIFPPNENSIVEKIYKIFSIEKLSLKFDMDSPSKTIPSNLYLLKNLKQLSIGSDIPIWVPNTLSYLDKLEELELYLLDQEKFPDPIFEMKALKKLDLSLNLFHEIPRDIWKLRNLEELNLSYCLNLESVPNELFGLPKLEKVYLLLTLIDEISPSIAYSNIKTYAIEIDSKESKRIMANPKLGTKLLRNIGKEKTSKFSLQFSSFTKNGRVIRVMNVPEHIKNRGLEVVKEYFKGKV